ncbi:MAG: hypothetical protein LBU83_00240 [Bacteroidales bacterium]|nr:hypothetical protein [Bacteroidales bacterium]
MHYAIKKHMESLKYGSHIDKMLAATEYLGIDFFKTIGSDNRFNEWVGYQYINLEKVPKVRMKTDMLIDFHHNHKSEFEIACFSALCALKSIVGNKSLTKTNFSRVIPLMIQESHELLEKYNKRYHRDKIMEELELSWGLKKLPIPTRGFWFSFQLDHNELAKQLVQRKQKKSELAERKRLAIEKAKREQKE